MSYGDAKVYFDGSHYVAIPHTERPQKPRAFKQEKEIFVNDKNEMMAEYNEEKSTLTLPSLPTGVASLVASTTFQ
jgi:hypothetical protein